MSRGTVTVSHRPRPCSHTVPGSVSIHHLKIKEEEKKTREKRKKFQIQRESFRIGDFMWFDRLERGVGKRERERKTERE